ncbi:hypothetical protein EC844_1457 [Acinetobacter calcoaceticus]|uniref:Uncharacterized protein n=1 Tax=Acinetobacter calcoaceticus TaxID=471 RepID=A0A4R1X757_ACICA|nr:hypothetical protein EC844_1457 [Acinetobacter calcoaceticus]
MRNSKYYILVIGILFSAWCSAEKENNMIDINKKKSWCIGRYAVDLPVEAIRANLN